MSRYVFKMPDLGEGTVEAEIVAWHVKPGDRVQEGDTIAEASTEKAVVEIPAPVSGRVVSVSGEPGSSIAVGAELIVFDSLGDVPAAAPVAKPPVAAVQAFVPTQATPALASRVMASPATRRRAQEAGIDLGRIAGSGPSGRVQRADLDAAIGRTAVEEIKVIGVRRVIAERMSEAKRSIPHFSYVEEVDVTELEALRRQLNARLPAGGAPLTPLPFFVFALARVLNAYPQCNAHYDAEKGAVLRYRAVHVGIATQTRDGLKVPVVRHAETRSLSDLAQEIRRVTDAARQNTATRDLLAGSTITVTSLGKLGGIVSTPVINLPEVAIIGMNKMIERPVVRQGVIAVSQMMNLSSSFDHRFVDGYDAASMIQSLKELLEHPAMIFMPDLAS